MKSLTRTSVGRTLLASLLIFAATAATAAEEIFNRSFTVTPGGLLTVTAGAADVVVSGSDASQVVVRMTVRDSQAKSNALKPTASQSATGVTVELLPPQGDWFSRLFGWWGSWDLDARIEVQVPRRYRVELKTSGGDIVVSHLDGSATGRTSGGDVNLEDVTGEVRIGTSGGDVVANSVRGDIDASTSGGDVTLLRVDGKIRARTSGGDVHCELIGTNRGISAITSGGDILVTMAKGNAATFDAATSGGDIVTDFPVTTQSTGERRLSGPINGGGETIYARTSGGDIALRASQ